ncbi:MAG: flavodoxin family protein [Candidatus Omnitrophica bacterium]|nr:flavodoxin family protein [Candidatus Omnitrophota bacterium]
MNILLISASPRKDKSQTFILAKEVLRGCGALKSEIIQLCDYKINFCSHCEMCHKKILECPINDGVRGISEKMLLADGIIFSTPNYINQVTALMKAFWERASHFIHCRRFLGKYICGVVTSGSGHDQEVLNYICYYANVCAAQYSGGMSSRVPVSKAKIEEAFKLGKKFALDIQQRTSYSEQLKNIEAFKAHFRNVIIARKNDWPEEYRYWTDKDWL